MSTQFPSEKVDHQFQGKLSIRLKKIVVYRKLIVQFFVIFEDTYRDELSEK